MTGASQARPSAYLAVLPPSRPHVRAMRPVLRPLQPSPPPPWLHNRRHRRPPQPWWRPSRRPSTAARSSPATPPVTVLLAAKSMVVTVGGLSLLLGRPDTLLAVGTRLSRWDKMGQNGEHPAKRSRRAWRGLHACSWRPGPRAGRRGQRRGAHQWAPIEYTVRKSICVLSSPPRRRHGRTRSTAARRPCTATTPDTRIHVSIIKACSASIEPHLDVEASDESGRSVSASICSSAPMA